jgi:hypothetical protein
VVVFGALLLGCNAMTWALLVTWLMKSGSLVELWLYAGRQGLSILTVSCPLLFCILFASVVHRFHTIPPSPTKVRTNHLLLSISARQFKTARLQSDHAWSFSAAGLMMTERHARSRLKLLARWPTVCDLQPYCLLSAL